MDLHPLVAMLNRSYHLPLVVDSGAGGLGHRSSARPGLALLQWTAAATLYVAVCGACVAEHVALLVVARTAVQSGHLPWLPWLP